MKPKQYFTTTEAAQRLGISVKRMQRLCNQGRIPEAERLGTRWMLPRSFTVTPGKRGPALRIGEKS